MLETKEWRPNPGPQTEAFRYFHVYELLYGGSKGGGKTEYLIFDFIEPSLIEKGGYRGIIFRRTFPRLREIIDRSLQYLQDQASYSKLDRCWTWPSGAKLYFSHCQHEEDKYDFQGHQYQYMGFDQLEEFTENQYSFLTIQCRTVDKNIPVRIRSTANPGNIGHLWVKRKFIDDKIPMRVYKDGKGLTSIFIPSKVYDNPKLIDNDPMYVKRLESLPEKERKALLEGDWNIFSGQYFNEWSPRHHIVKPFFIPSTWQRFVAMDYGLRRPSSVGWYAVDHDGDVVRYKEIFKEGLYYDDLALKICEMSEDENISYCVADPAIFGDKQHHSNKKDAREGESGAEVMQGVINKWFEDKGRAKDSFLMVRGDNRRIEGWRAVKQRLRVREDESVGFKVFSTCTGFITNFPANVHDENRPEDLDTLGPDDCADECRYALASRPPPAELEMATNDNLSHTSPLYKMKQVRKKRIEEQSR